MSVPYKLLIAVLMAFGWISSGHTETVVIYGATGNMGSVFVEEGLMRGHQVIGVSRDPSRFDVEHENFTAVQGDITDIDSIRQITANADWVIVSVHGTPTTEPEDSVQNQAAKNFIQLAAERGEAQPHVLQINGGSSLYIGDEQLFEKMPELVRPNPGSNGYALMWGHHVALETYLASEGVKWTVLTAAPGARSGKRTGEYRIGGDQMMGTASGKFFPVGDYGEISHQDMGVAIFNEFEEPEHIGKRFTIAY